MAPRRTHRACALAAAALVTAGCQTYRPQPVDLASHREAWGRRAVDSEEVLAFAARLAANPDAGGPFDAADGLSLAEAEAVTLLYNADLRLARIRAIGAGSVARKAGRFEDPRLGLEVERIVPNVRHQWIAAAAVGLTLPFSGRLQAERRHACAEERAAIARVAADEWAARMRLRALWVQWSIQSLRADLATTLCTRLDEVARVAARLEEAGELSRVEARLFRAERATRVLEVQAARTKAQQLMLDIKSTMGLLPTAPVDMRQAFTVAPPALPILVETSPRMQVLEAEYDVVEEALRLEIRKQYPDIEIGPGFKQEDGDPRVLLGVDFPRPLWNANARGIAEARARRDTARAEHEAAYEALVAAAAAAESALAGAAAQRAEIEATLVPLVDEQAADIARIADLGQVNTLVMLDTLVRQHEARLKLLDARLEEALAAVRLNEIAGPMATKEEGP